MDQMPGVNERPFGPRVTTWQDAERCAAAWVRVMGHPDAHVTASGADCGIDVIAGHAAAQVKFQVGTKVSRPQVQQLVGAAGRTDVDLFFFSLAGYTGEALDWAAQAGVAAFQLEVTGDITPLNEPARVALRMISGNPWATGHAADTGTPRGSGLPIHNPARAGVWRRAGAWFGRLLRTVAWEARRVPGPEPLGDRLMSGITLAGSGVGFFVVGIVGVIAMISETIEPTVAAGRSPAESIAGAFFYAFVALFGAWCFRLGCRRQARLSRPDAAEFDASPPKLQAQDENDCSS